MPGTILTVLHSMAHLILETALLGRAIILLHRGQSQAQRPEVMHQAQQMKVSLSRSPESVGQRLNF